MKIRSAARASLVAVTFSLITVNALAQTPPLVFTVMAPDRESAAPTTHTFPVVEERGLALWAGVATDFGVGVDLAGSDWTVRSVTSLTILPIGGGWRPTFAQVEVLRPVFATASTSVAAGGGIREEWDGTRVLIGRALMGHNVGRGRLQGSLVLERASSPAIRRDAADMVTSAGWSTLVTDRIALGIEGIGQDMEAFWDRSEADGGAKLLVGPSIRVQSRSGNWTAAATAGPVFSSPPIGSPSGSARADFAGGHHFGVFASGTWIPSQR